ncbi:MAG: hypothetical protein CMH50_06270 [Myxococcales bacterium]|nr:hypothetical protein [Myxococcales bacterium]
MGRTAATGVGFGSDWHLGGPDLGTSAVCPLAQGVSGAGQADGREATLFSIFASRWPAWNRHRDILWDGSVDILNGLFHGSPTFRVSVGRPVSMCSAVATAASLCAVTL